MFKAIPISGAIDAALVNRIQAAVSAEFAALEAPGNLGVTSIAASKQLTTYQVQSGDRYVVVDATSGALTVNLPAPGNQAIVTVIKADASPNAVTIVYQATTDPKLGLTSIQAPATLLNTGTTWQVIHAS